MTIKSAFTRFFLSLFGGLTFINRLVEISHNLLEILCLSLSPSVIPTKYNIIVHLWTYRFYKLLESIHRASFSSPLALEH